MIWLLLCWHDGCWGAAALPKLRRTSSSRTRHYYSHVHVTCIALHSGQCVQCSSFYPHPRTLIVVSRGPRIHCKRRNFNSTVTQTALRSSRIHLHLLYVHMGQTARCFCRSPSASAIQPASRLPRIHSPRFRVLPRRLPPHPHRRLCHLPSRFSVLRLHL